MGTGEQQVLAMAFAYAFAKAFHGGMLLIIEEPEAHLHPLAQQWLAHRLQNMASGGLQVLLTTHSPAFIDPLKLEGLVVVRKEEGRSQVVQIDRNGLLEHCRKTGVPEGALTSENILPRFAAHATKEILEGFFGKVVVLVEGPTEALALPIYFARCGFDVTREGIAIIPVHGKGNLAKWYRLFTAYRIPIYVIVDNDTSEDQEGKKREAVLIALGVPASEQGRYIGTREWLIEKDVCVFGEDFESCLRQYFEGYKTAEEEAQRNVGSKPFAAKWVVEHLTYNQDDSGWEKTRVLVEAIRGKIRR
jgi:putative ATP-dependent endonuclease of OLD family